MIQELISTSSPKCLDGNAGFGVVAQTSGMPPNVSRDIANLSGYSHTFPAGDPRNPVAFLHAVRRSGGVDRHAVSRVADCGNDYSGRTNRIGHHWIIEETDLAALSAGPAAIASQPNIFLTAWNEKSQELPRGKQLPNPSANGGVCRHWQQRYGDAGWGGVVAERIEKGDPISIIFEPGTDVLPLIAEAFALLPPALRWKTTFSTFFMKSQEPPGVAKIQVKCIAAGSDEIAFAKLSPRTLVIDLRQSATEQPSGKYVDVARNGPVVRPVRPTAPIPTSAAVPTAVPSSAPQSHVDVPLMVPGVAEQTYSVADPFDEFAFPPPSIPVGRPYQPSRRKKKSGFPWLLLSIIGLLLVLAPIGVFLTFSGTTVTEIATAGKQAEEEHKAAEEAEKQKREKAEQERNATEAQAEQKRKDDEEKAADEKKKEEKRKVDAIKAAAGDAKAAMKIAEDKFNAAQNQAEAAKKAAEAAENAAQNKTPDIDTVEGKLQEAENYAGEANTATQEAESQAKIARTAADDVKNAANELKKEATQSPEATAEISKAVGEADAAAQTARKQADEAKAQFDEAKNVIAKARDSITNAKSKALIQNQLNVLGAVWKDIALPMNKRGVQILPGSEFLGKLHKENRKVEISVAPFVDLKIIPKFESSEEQKTNKFEIREKESSEKHRIEFSYVEVSPEAPSSEKIIEFFLNEKGIFCQWGEGVLRTYNDTEHRRIFNRVLLSQLKIEVDGFEKVIALWTPVEYNSRDFKKEFSVDDERPRFTLWGHENGKEFIANIVENEFMLLDFDEFVFGDKHKIESKTFAKFPSSLSYAPQIPSVDGSTAHCGIAGAKLKDEDKNKNLEKERLKIVVDFLPPQAVKFEEKDEEIEKEIKKFQRELATERNKCGGWNQLEVEHKRRKSQNEQLGKQNEQLGKQIQNVSLTQEERLKIGNVMKANGNTIKANEAEIKRLDGILAEKKRLEDEINGQRQAREANNAAIKAERGKWNDARVEHFSIDLIRTGTEPSEVHKPENRLPLFRVVPDKE